MGKENDFKSESPVELKNLNMHHQMVMILVKGQKCFSNVSVALTIKKRIQKSFHCLRFLFWLP